MDGFESMIFDFALLLGSLVRVTLPGPVFSLFRNRNGELVDVGDSGDEDICSACTVSVLSGLLDILSGFLETLAPVIGELSRCREPRGVFVGDLPSIGESRLLVPILKSPLNKISGLTKKNTGLKGKIPCNWFQRACFFSSMAISPGFCGYK